LGPTRIVPRRGEPLPAVAQHTRHGQRRRRPLRPEYAVNQLSASWPSDSEIGPLSGACSTGVETAFGAPARPRRFWIRRSFLKTSSRPTRRREEGLRASWTREMGADQRHSAARKLDSSSPDALLRRPHRFLEKPTPPAACNDDADRQRPGARSPHLSRGAPRLAARGSPCRATSEYGSGDSTRQRIS
jgi:hypothetical protein